MEPARLFKLILAMTAFMDGMRNEKDGIWDYGKTKKEKTKKIKSCVWMELKRGT